MNEDSLKNIQQVKEYAENHVLSRNDLRDNLELMSDPVGDNPNHRCVIPNGYQAVYSLEDQPCGICHHLSISIDEPNKVPDLASVEMIMEKFGLDSNIDNCSEIWFENDVRIASGQMGTAINILQLKKEN